MNDTEFIELLNLYLDHEISAADAARLEAEVQSSPRRRQVYREYCQMQKACKVLAADFETEVVPNTVSKVVPFAGAPGAARTRALYVLGSVAAAAACVALIFVARSKPSSVPAAAPAAATVAVRTAPAPVAAALVAEASPAARGIIQRPMLVSDPLLLAGRPAAAEFARTAQPNEQLAWIGALQMAPVPQPVPIEALRFEARAPIMPQDNRGLPNRSGAGEAAAEMTAFRFVK
jgi:hypothetical protein